MIAQRTKLRYSDSGHEKQFNDCGVTQCVHLLIGRAGVGVLRVYFGEKLFDCEEGNRFRQNQWFAETSLQLGKWGD